MTKIDLDHYAVIQNGYAIYGVGATEDEAREDAEQWMDRPSGAHKDEPGIDGECKICGNHSKLITSYWMGKKSPQIEAAQNPHAAKTRGGKRYSIGLNDTEIEIMNGACLGSETAICPIAIHENAKTGDNILCWSTHYDKASLVRSVHHRFILPKATPDYKIKSRLIFAIGRLLGKTIDRDSTKHGEIAQNYSDEINRHGSAIDAAKNIFKIYCPEPIIQDYKNHQKWTDSFKYIEGDNV